MLTLLSCQRHDDKVRIVGSARRHGITEAAIRHALRNAIRYVVVEYDGAEQVLIIGTDDTGRLLEIVAVPADEPLRVIHADVLRRKFYDYL